MAPLAAPRTSGLLAPLRGWVKRAAIAPKGRQRIAWGVSPRFRSQPRSQSPEGAIAGSRRSAGHLLMGEGSNVDAN